MRRRAERAVDAGDCVPGQRGASKGENVKGREGAIVIVRERREARRKKAELPRPPSKSVRIEILLAPIFSSNFRTNRGQDDHTIEILISQSGPVTRGGVGN